MHVGPLLSKAALEGGNTHCRAFMFLGRFAILTMVVGGLVVFRLCLYDGVQYVEKRWSSRGKKVEGRLEL